MCVYIYIYIYIHVYIYTHIVVIKCSRSSTVMLLLQCGILTQEVLLLAPILHTLVLMLIPPREQEPPIPTRNIQ